MTRFATLAVAALLVSVTLVATLPTANAAFQCSFGPAPTGGFVGRTYEFGAAIGEAACNETSAYLVYVCTTLIGPSPTCAMIL